MRYVLVGGRYGGMTGEIADTEHTIRVRINEKTDDGRHWWRGMFSEEFHRTDRTQAGLRVYEYFGYVWTYSNRLFGPGREELERVELIDDWQTKVVPLLESLDIHLSGYVEGYEWDDYGIDIQRGGAWDRIWSYEKDEER